MRLFLYKPDGELLAVARGIVYPRTSIADVEMISTPFCWEFGSRFVGNTVTKNSLWALEITPFIRKRFPVCNISVGLFKSESVSKMLGSVALRNSTMSHQLWRKSKPYHLDEIDWKQ